MSLKRSHNAGEHGPSAARAKTGIRMALRGGVGAGLAAAVLALAVAASPALAGSAARASLPLGFSGNICGLIKSSEVKAAGVSGSCHSHSLTSATYAKFGKAWAGNYGDITARKGRYLGVEVIAFTSSGTTV